MERRSWSGVDHALAYEISPLLSESLFHGRRGEVRKRYRERQEDQLGALGLVVNAVVLWNTRYNQAALDQLRASGAEVRDVDAARISPLRFELINMLGRDHFDLAESVARGELRRLRDPHQQKKLEW